MSDREHGLLVHPSVPGTWFTFFSFCPLFVRCHYPALFSINITNKPLKGPRAGEANEGLSLQSWFCTVCTESVEERPGKLLSSGRCGFMFGLVSGVLCGRPILLTHWLRGNWFGVSYWDLRELTLVQIETGPAIEGLFKFIAGSGDRALPSEV